MARLIRASYDVTITINLQRGIVNSFFFAGRCCDYRSEESASSERFLDFCLISEVVDICKHIC